MSGVTSILVLLVATVALAQTPPAQTGPKRLGSPVLPPGAGTMSPTAAPARPATPGVGAAQQPPATAPGTVVPKRLGRPVLVPPVAPAGTPGEPPQRR